MSETLHLQRRGSTWHYDRRTLRTAFRSSADASSSAAEETKGKVTGTSAHKTCISLDMLIEYVRKYVGGLGQRLAEEFATSPTTIICNGQEACSPSVRATGSRFIPVSISKKPSSGRPETDKLLSRL